MKYKIFNYILNQFQAVINLGYYWTLQSVRNIHALQGLEKWLLTALLLLICCIQAYHFIQLPYHSDELYSAYFYVEKGFVYTLTHYENPNNHVFFNLLSTIIYKITQHAAGSIRLVSILSEMLFAYIIFSYLLLKKDFNTAVIVTLTCLCSISFTVFALSGRGYMLETLFTFISLICILNENQTQVKRNIFIVCNALALFTVISHAYILIGLLLSYLIIHPKNTNKNFQFVFKSALGIAVITAVCYSPIWFLNGMDAMFNNEWVKGYGMNIIPFTQKVMVPALLESVQFLFGIYWIKGKILGLILIGILTFGFYKKDKLTTQILIVFCSCIFSLIAFSYFKNRFPPYRTLVPVVALLMLCMGLILSNYKILASVVLLALIGYNMFFFNINTTNKEANALIDFAKIVHQNTHSVTIFHDCYQLRYYLDQYQNQKSVLTSAILQDQWIVCTQKDVQKINRNQYAVIAAIDYDYVLLKRK